MQLYRLHAAQTFDEVRLLRGGEDKLFVHRLAHWAKQHPTQQRINNRDGEHNERKVHAVNCHDGEHTDREHAVDQHFERAAGERALDRVHRRKAREQIADVALLKKREWQAQQMREQLRQYLKRQRARKMQQ